MNGILNFNRFEMRLYQILQICRDDKYHTSHGIFSSETAVVDAVTQIYISGLEKINISDWYRPIFEEFNSIAELRDWLVSEFRKIGSLEELRNFFKSHKQRDELWCIAATNKILPFAELWIFEFELNEIKPVEMTMLRRNEYLSLVKTTTEKKE